MARLRPRSRRPTTAALSLVVVLLVLLAGVLFRYAPFLTRARQPVAGVPAPPGMVIATHFALPARRRACLDSVSMTPQSQLVGFSIYPGPSSPHGGAPVQVTFAAPGYSAATYLSGGYPGGYAALPIQPPRHSLIATVCFRNLGKKPVLLLGTTEYRSITRSRLTIGGVATLGEIAVRFTQSRPSSVLSELGAIVDHASNLTDGLLPPALVWAVLGLAALGIPIGFMAALYLSLETSPTERTL